MSNSFFTYRFISRETLVGRLQAKNGLWVTPGGHEAYTQGEALYVMGHEDGRLDQQRLDLVGLFVSKGFGPDEILDTMMKLPGCDLWEMYAIVCADDVQGWEGLKAAIGTRVAEAHQELARQLASQNAAT